MLLNYNIDTKDEALNPTAIELRRRLASRKLQEDVASNAVDDQLLIAFKEKNRDERKEQGVEQLGVTMAGVNQRVAMTRLDQQMSIHRNLSSLDRDIGRISRLNKTRVDSLGDLTKRIQHMRAQLKQPVEVSVESEMAETLRSGSNSKGLVELNFTKCTLCQRKILKALYEGHVKACELNFSRRGPDGEMQGKAPVFDVNVDLITSVTTFPPQPPRNLHIRSKGATFVTLGWEPPVIDGGLPVFDYEITYQVNIMEMNKKTGKYRIYSEYPLPITTTHWLLADPIAHNGYKITSLRSGAEFTAFKVRCKNLRGWSDYCVINPLGNSMIKKKVNTASSSNKKAVAASYFAGGGGGDSSGGRGNDENDEDDEGPDVMQNKTVISTTQLAIKTSEPEPPSMPLYFQCNRVTSTCLYLSWQPPYYDGGQEITNYTIYYTVIERHISATSRNILIDKPAKYTVGPELQAVVRNLGSDLDVKDIYIKATNKADLVGETGVLDNNKGVPPKTPTVLHTKEASMYAQLKKQLHEASKMTTEYVETDFLNGIAQKILRIEFMRELNVRLKAHKPDPEEQEEAAKWASIRKKKEEDRRREELEQKMLDGVSGGGDNMAQLLAQLDADAGAGSDDDSDDGGDKKPTFIFPWRQRKAHFIRRIKILEDRIKSCTEERYDIDKNRTRFTNAMKKTQTRAMNLRLELDNLKQFKGDHITSSILHGAAMKYQAKDFIRAVDAELNRCVAEIADTKLRIIKGEERKKYLKDLLVKSEEYLKNRRAEFFAFNKTEEFMQNKMFKLGSADQDIQIMRKYFNFLKFNRDDVVECRALVKKKFEDLLFRKLKSAWMKWRTGSFEDFNEFEDVTINADGTYVRKAHITGVGTMLLKAAETKRKEMQANLRRAIAEAASLKEKWKMVSLPPDSRKKLLASAAFSSMEEGRNHVAMQVSSLTFLFEGDGLTLLNKFDEAIRLYEAQIIKLRSNKDNIEVKSLAICHGRMGKLFLKKHAFDRAIVEYDRQLSLAKEVDDKYEAAEAYYGMGIGYYYRAQYDYSIRYLNIAQVQFQAIGNYARCSAAMEGLRDCYIKLHKDEVVAMFSEQIDRIGDELNSKIRSINAALENMKSRLVSTTASIEHNVTLERTTHKVISLRRYIDERNEELIREERRLEEQEKETEAIRDILDRIQEETDIAYDTDELELWSDLVHDQPQMVEVEELKNRLHARKLVEVAKIEECSKVEAAMHTVIKNCEDDIEAAQQNIDLEGGPLACKARRDKPFRAMAFNPANAAGDEVTGTATGGVENFVAAEGKNIHLFNNHNGELEFIFIGDNKDRVGEKAGHVGVVTCLALDMYTIFSGGADEVIISWNVKTLKKELEMHGHEGSITWLAVGGPILASGSADCTIRFWEKSTGTQIRVLHGHSKTIMSIDIGLTWMVSGGADEEVRVWEIKRKSAHTLTAETTHQLLGHEQPVTCVKYGKLEVMSGDNLGRIFIWWLETSTILRKCQVHDGPVRCLQFDAIHIVSGGVDASVCITDIATGEVLQSLRGHDRHVLEVSFDSTRILSASADNTLRYWQWGKKVGPQDKFHVLNKQETLVMLSKMHGVSVDNLMKWNGIFDMRTCYPGMKLIVKKGDPTQLTEAEKLAVERDRRRQVGLSYTSKKLQSSAAGKQSKLNQYNRVQKLATDMDKHSLSNRLFGKEKHLHDILPDMQDLNTNVMSLTNRLLRDEETLQATTVDLEKHMKERSEISRRAGYIFRAENMEDEWGEIADSIGMAMIDLFVEYEAYDFAVSSKNALRDKKSTIGRIYAHQQRLRDEADAIEREKLLAIQRQEEEAAEEARKKEEEEDAMLAQHEERQRLRALRRLSRFQVGQGDYDSEEEGELPERLPSIISESGDEVEVEGEKGGGGEDGGARRGGRGSRRSRSASGAEGDESKSAVESGDASASAPAPASGAHAAIPIVYPVVISDEELARKRDEMQRREEELTAKEAAERVSVAEAGAAGATEQEPARKSSRVRFSGIAESPQVELLSEEPAQPERSASSSSLPPIQRPAEGATASGAPVGPQPRSRKVDSRV